MKLRFLFIITIVMLMLMFTACDDKDNDPNEAAIAAALNNYWQYQTDLAGTLASREASLDEIQAAIAAMEGSTKGRDAFDDITALVEGYASECDAVAADFQVLATAENAIVEYGEDKGLLGSVAKGIYNTAANAVISTGQQIRSGWRVLSGQQSISQVVHDPNSGIPLLSGWAKTIQDRNNARDAKIKQEILNWNANSAEDTAHLIPYDDLPGTTNLEKANAYLNLSDEDPMKMQARAGVIVWDHDENVATAKASGEIAETGVKGVADALGNEVVNEVLIQHMEEGQDEDDAGTLNVNVNSGSSGNPPIATGRTIVISKNNMPSGDPRITIIPNAPQTLEQPLPEGSYSIIVLADGFIRGVYENLQIVQGQINNVATQLLKLSENPIIIESLSVEEGSITKDQPVHAHVSCVSTIGKALSFNWTVSGGTYTALQPNATNLTFTPTEEKEYTITVVVSDDAGNSKTRSISVAALGGSLVIDDWEISSENFTDDKLNPGETATVTLYVSNTGTTPISGQHAVMAGPGFSSSFSPASVSIGVGQTLAVNVPIVVHEELSLEQLHLQYLFTTENQNGDAVIISDAVELPIDFYVQIDDITDVVTNRILNITGRIANPQLHTAVLILDNDIEHAFDLNLNSGNFTQQIVLTGSAQEVQHTVRVVAVSGALAAEDTMTFSAQVPLMALLATLTWNTGGTDVDFWITDPNGERCYYAHPYTASGLALDVDDTNGYGPENITTAAVIPGDYLVQVHYYSDHDSENAIGSDCFVVIQEGDEAPVNYYGYLSDSGDIWNVTTLHYSPVKGWSVKPNNTYGKVNPASLPAK